MLNNSGPVEMLQAEWTQKWKENQKYLWIIVTFTNVIYPKGFSVNKTLHLEMNSWFLAYTQD